MEHACLVEMTHLPIFTGELGLISCRADPTAVDATGFEALRGVFVPELDKLDTRKTPELSESLVTDDGGTTDGGKDGGGGDKALEASVEVAIRVARHVAWLWVYMWWG